MQRVALTEVTLHSAQNFAINVSLADRVQNCFCGAIGNALPIVLSMSPKGGP